jgi:hypothetical protein
MSASPPLFRRIIVSNFRSKGFDIRKNTMDTFLLPHTHKSRFARLMQAFLILALVFTLAQPATAAQANPGILPPNSNPFGKSYAEWAAEWWKYALSLPAASSPLTDPTGANCGVGQSGPVFFLVGTADGSTVVRDQCEVPVGKAIFFPAINFICAVPEDGNTPSEIRDLCSWATDFIDLARVTVDGTETDVFKDYRFPTPFFPFYGAVNNPFDQACGTPGTCYEGFHTTGFSDGYWVMLPPLSAGKHTIQITGHFYLPDFNWEFNLNVTYHLTVTP